MVIQISYLVNILLTAINYPNSLVILVFVRHVLANLHFNGNLERETMKSKEGTEYMRVPYPKFKLGEEVVRKIAVPPTYGKQFYM